MNVILTASFIALFKGYMKYRIQEEHNMKKRIWKRTSIFLCLLMLAMVFAVAVPMNISADSEVPFKGNYDGNTVPLGDPDIERIEMSGKASHLGKYKAVVEADMTGYTVIGWDSDLSLPIISLPTTATFTAANGDELYADLILVGPFGGNFPSFTLDGDITGGTGRFEGATGSFSGSGGQTTVPGQDNDLITGTFGGTISTVGSNK
jgi:hypothetical protein